MIFQSGERRRGPVLLGFRNSVIVTLILIRQNLPQTVLADVFGVSQPTISRTYRSFLPIITKALCLHAPQLREAVRGRLVLVDGTDVPTGNRAGHSHNYSGKRHRSGVNIQIAASSDGQLLAVSDPMPGSTHDRRAFAECGWEAALADCPVIADPAYQGTHTITPRKRPPRGALSENDKQCNKNISATRAAVERCIAHLKNWKILKTGYRGRLVDLPAVIYAIAALEFYRLGW